MLSGRAVLVWLPGSRVDSLARTLGRPRDHRNRYLRQVLTNPGIAMKGLQTGQLEKQPRDRRQVFSDPGPTYRLLEIRPRDRRRVFSDPGPTYRSLPRDHRQVLTNPGPTYRRVFERSRTSPKRYHRQI